MSPISTTLGRPRPATRADVDAMARCALSSWTGNQIWEYRHRYKNEYPDDYWKYTRMLYDFLTSTPQKDVVLVVIEAPRIPVADDPGRHVDGETEIAALAIWDWRFLNRREFGDDYVPCDPFDLVKQNGGATRRDMCHRRNEAFFESQERAAHEAFTSKLGNNQLSLLLLIVRPEHRRRGFGSALVRWGIEKAAEAAVPVTVDANPMGRKLYQAMGFVPAGPPFVCKDPEDDDDIFMMIPVIYRHGKEDGACVGGGRARGEHVEEISAD